MEDKLTRLQYCSSELKRGVSFLQSFLESEIFRLVSDGEEETLLNYVEEFYVMFRIGHPIVSEFIKIIQDKDFRDSSIFDNPHKLYYFHKMGFKENQNFQDTLNEFIKEEQRRSGFIFCNKHNHAGPMRVLAQSDPESEYTSLAIKYFIQNYDEEECSINSIGILTLFEYDYYKYRDLLQKYVEDLKKHFNEKGCIEDNYLRISIENTSLAIQAISYVCGMNDPHVVRGVNWIKNQQNEEGYFSHKRVNGQAILALMSAGEGIKIPLEEMEKLELLQSQRIKSINRNVNSNMAMMEIAVEKDAKAVSILEEVISRFHILANQLQNRYSSRPVFRIQDEYDVQDLLHSILRIFFDDIRPEEWTPSYAGKCSRVDFLLKNEQVVIEVKKTRQNLGAKEIGDQLIIDIARYKVHPNCKMLYCFVYDPDYIVQNPRGIEVDLSCNYEDFDVIVKIVPKGF